MTTTNNVNPHVPRQPAGANAYGLPDPWEVEAWALPYFPEFGGVGAASRGIRPNVSGYGEPETREAQGAYPANISGYGNHDALTAQSAFPNGISGYGAPGPQAAQGAYPTDIQGYGVYPNIPGYREPDTQIAYSAYPDISGYGEPDPRAAQAQGVHPDIQGYREPQVPRGERPDYPEYRDPAHSARNPVTYEEAEYLSQLPWFGSSLHSGDTAAGGNSPSAENGPASAGNNPTTAGNDSSSLKNDSSSVNVKNDSPPSVKAASGGGNNETGYSPVVVPATGTHGPNGFDVNRIRADFPILSEKVNGGKQLVWLDNGATTQKPRQVIDRISYFYEHENSNIHRAAHELAARSSDAYEAARQITADFLGAPSKDNIVFVRGTTEGINLVAQAYVKPLLSAGDEIVLTVLEHHANIVPWQLIAQETGAVIKVAPVDDSGQIILSEYARLFGKRTKFASVTHVSNALGTITPIHEMVKIAHCCGVRILIDGAQSVAHAPVNMEELGADFFVMSGHKIFAPTGIGALYGRADALEEAGPYQGGGNMIKDVTFERTVYNPPPNKFEAGTGNIADAIGLGAALDYVSKVGIGNISAYEHELLDYATGRLSRIKGLRLIGTAAEKASVLSFVMDNVSVQEVGKHLSDKGIAVRAGHHCAQPILRRFGLEATVRPTLAFYNTVEEVDKLVSAVSELAR